MVARLTRTARLVLAALVCLGACSGVAGACTVTETKTGLRFAGDCFAFPEVKRRQPNLVVPFLDAHPNQTSVIMELKVKNTGPVGSEGELGFVLLSLDGEEHPRGGRFDLMMRVEVRDPDGHIVQIWDEYSGQWHDYLELRERAQRLGPGEAHSYLIGQFHLPDRARNYDICVFAMADPATVALPGGEIWESAENDNRRFGAFRLFPSQGEPDYERPLCVFGE